MKVEQILKIQFNPAEQQRMIDEFDKIINEIGGSMKFAENCPNLKDLLDILRGK